MNMHCLLQEGGGGVWVGGNPFARQNDNEKKKSPINLVYKRLLTSCNEMPFLISGVCCTTKRRFGKHYCLSVWWHARQWNGLELKNTFNIKEMQAPGTQRLLWCPVHGGYCSARYTEDIVVPVTRMLLRCRYTEVIVVPGKRRLLLCPVRGGYCSALYTEVIVVYYL